MDAPHRLGIGVVLFAAMLAGIPRAVAQSTPSLAQWRLEGLVGSAGARADEYFALFSDLTATETKTVEEFRDSGQISARREIVSDLIVYKSQVDRGSISEFRDVKLVDGAPVTGREQRVLALFERGGRADSVRDELARVSREGSRYDLDHTIAGLTIGQALPVRATSRSFFEFTLDGEDRVEGRRVLVLDYRQVAPNPRFGIDLSLPSDFRRASPSYRGRLWIDAVTSQVWREIREVVVEAPRTGAPVVVQRFEFDYTPSRFDVPLPKRIVFSAFLHFSKQDGAIASSLSYRISFAYGEFRRFTTTSDDGEIARVAPPDAAPSGPETPAEKLGPEFGPDAPLGPPDPQPAQPQPTAPQPTQPPPTQPQPQPQPRPQPRPQPSARRAPPMVGAAPESVAAPATAVVRDLPPSVPAPAAPVISIAPPPPPPAPGVRFRVPPS